MVKQIAAVSLIALVVFSSITIYLQHKANQPEPPEALIERVSLANDYLFCDDENTVTLFYSLYHISGKMLGERQPYYLRLNQTKNTCFDGTFFYERFPLCYNLYTTGNRVISCAARFEPLTEDTPTDALSYLGNETTTFLNKMKEQNQSEECEISEVIEICVSIGGEISCSEPTELKLKYIPCTS